MGRAVRRLLFGLVLMALAVVVVRSRLEPASTPADTNTDDATDIGDGTSGQDRATDDGLDGLGADERFPIQLERVIDGDSLRVLIDGESTDLRLPGINAPELFRLHDDARSCNGQSAKRELERLLAGAELLAVGTEFDRFDRLLADVIIGSDSGSNSESGSEGSASRSMVVGGWALAAGADTPYRAEMKQAAERRLGLWGDECGPAGPTPPVIGATQVDPPGRDQDNLNEEWVTVVNPGDATVDLAGWVISDDTTGHRFVLDGELGPGRELTIRTGTGDDGPDDRYLGERFPVWSNRGETVLLVDSDGVVVSWRFIDP